MARGRRDDRMIDKASIMHHVRVGIAEFVGTGLLVLIGCMGCMSPMAPGGIPHQQISFTFGFAVMFCIQIFAHISGGHVNPAVTLTAVVLGHVSYVMIPTYFIMQTLGGVVGFALLKAVTPDKFFDMARNSTGFGVCSSIPNPEIHVLQALSVEIIITLVLCLLCCAIWDPRNTNKHDSLTIRFGLTVAGLAMAAGPYSSASLNPARSFGPCLINGDWDAHWIFWVGPLAAAVMAGGFYRVLYSVPKPAPGPEEIPLSR